MLNILFPWITLKNNIILSFTVLIGIKYYAGDYIVIKMSNRGIMHSFGRPLVASLVIRSAVTLDRKVDNHFAISKYNASRPVGSPESVMSDSRSKHCLQGL